MRGSIKNSFLRLTTEGTSYDEVDTVEKKSGRKTKASEADGYSRILTEVLRDHLLSGDGSKDCTEVLRDHLLSSDGSKDRKVGMCDFGCSSSSGAAGPAAAKNRLLTAEKSDASVPERTSELGLSCIGFNTGDSL